MNATRYTDILDASLVPFIEGHYPRFQQDNDPKHTSRWAKDCFDRKGIKWWKTPASSPDLNPIENVWGYVTYELTSSQEMPRSLKMELRSFGKL